MPDYALARKKSLIGRILPSIAVLALGWLIFALGLLVGIVLSISPQAPYWMS